MSRVPFCLGTSDSRVCGVPMCTYVIKSGNFLLLICLLSIILLDQMEEPRKVEGSPPPPSPMFLLIFWPSFEMSTPHHGGSSALTLLWFDPTLEVPSEEAVLLGGILDSFPPHSEVAFYERWTNWTLPISFLFFSFFKWWLNAWNI